MVTVITRMADANKVEPGEQYVIDPGWPDPPGEGANIDAWQRSMNVASNLRDRLAARIEERTAKAVMKGGDDA